MKIKAKRNFGLKGGKHVDKGDVLDLPKERAESAIERGLAEKVKTEKKGKPKKKKAEKK